jgi:phenylacetate-coenzyme A ligase PaaK-like adenylate-forming protein
MDVVIVGRDREAALPRRVHSELELGQRTLNRFQRMAIADEHGVPVAAFGSPGNDEGLSRLAREWGETAVLKYDWSSRRNGVLPRPLGSDRKPFPLDFGVGRDVFMEFLADDPWTYKIDVFGGTILGGWILQTRSMRNANWQVIENQELLDFDPPMALQQKICALGERLLEHGVGNASFDLMRAAGGFRLIEANTCAVSTAAWARNPERYASRLASAIIQILKRPDAIPEYRRLREQARQAGNEQSAVSLKETPANPAGDRTPAPAGLAPRWGAPSTEQLFYKRLTDTEKLPPHQLAPIWRVPAQMLLKHASSSVPFYRDRLAGIFSWNGSVDWNRWSDIPVTTRDDARLHRDAMLSRGLTPTHGSTVFAQTSGTTGEPLATTVSMLAMAMDSCVQARLYQWHGVHTGDPMATLLRVNPLEPSPNRTWAPTWLRPPYGADHDGDRSASPEDQLRWLATLGPVYLRTRPSIARALAIAVARNPDLRPSLKGILTYGEVVSQDHRRLCRRHLGHDLIDAYRLVETGMIAVRCPVADVYHLQSEVCIVEVVDAAGRPCEPGQIGEIIVTPLYNYAMPLIRYATGDLAEMPARATSPDGRCSCGRTLPAIKRVLGRRRNLLRVASGPPFQPDLDSAILLDLLGARMAVGANRPPRSGIALRFG